MSLYQGADDDIAYLVRNGGLTPEQARGIVANIHAESGGRADAVGDGGKARGLVQWHPDRRPDGFDSWSRDDQLDHIIDELGTTEKRAGTALRNAKTAGDAAEAFARLYERPADPDGQAAKRRMLADGTASVAGKPNETPVPTAQPDVSSMIAQIQGPDVQSFLSRLYGDGAQQQQAPDPIQRSPILELLAKLGYA